MIAPLSPATGNASGPPSVADRVVGGASIAFTPPPWFVRHDDRRRFTVKSHGGLVASMAITRWSERADEGLANCHLIAAAPDGYAASASFVNAAVAEYNIPPDADEGWIVDTLGHGLGGAYMEAVAFLALARGETVHD